MELTLLGVLLHLLLFLSYPSYLWINHLSIRANNVYIGGSLTWSTEINYVLVPVFLPKSAYNYKHVHTEMRDLIRCTYVICMTIE